MLFRLVVTFCGHNTVEEPDAVRHWLERTVDALIQDGATTFYLGGYGGFDRLAAAVMWEVKNRNKGVESILVLPYLNRTTAVDLALYDGTIYPPLEKVGKRFAIVKRNQWMVDNADVVIAYVLHEWGGAVSMMRYAIRRQKEIIRYERLGP